MAGPAFTRAPDDAFAIGDACATDEGHVAQRQADGSTDSSLVTDATMSFGELAGAPPPPGFPESWRNRFRDIEQAGQGGMAVVYRAWDCTLSRAVALKVMRGDRAFSAEVEVRFRREAAAMARLSHPHIVAVHDTGIGDEHMWMVLEWIEGRTLAAMFAERRLERSEVLPLLLQTARAVQHAHERGIVHRDLKPSNILVTGDGAPKVADFGIAHFLSEDSALTRTEASIGTPRYMAPEQADPQRGGITVRTDVYALGVILYEGLTGQPPHVGDNVAAVIQAVLNVEPVPPRQLDRRIPVDLEAIALKALEKDPARRYASPAALADDLEAFLQGNPVAARRQTFAYRTLKRARKHKLAVAFASAALFATGTSLAWGVTSWLAGVEQARIAQRFGQRVERIEAMTRRSEMMPLHDLTPDRAEIRAQMDIIREDMATLGEHASAAGRYALGRGHLALGELEAAKAELEAAWQSGYQTPEAAYALGATWGRLYERHHRRASAIADKQHREAELLQVTAQYRDPALELLRSSRAMTGEAPEYIEGLIAYYEQRFDDALALAQQAYESRPWLYDAMRLEGDIHRRLSLTGADGAKASEHLEQARSAYTRALEVARSDVRSLFALCWLGDMHVVAAESGIAEGLDAHRSEYLRACEAATLADPSSGEAHEHLSLFHSRLGQLALKEGTDFTHHMQLAVEAGEKALELAPGDAGAHGTLGFAYYTLARLGRLATRDEAKDFDRAISHFTRVCELEPQDDFARAHLALSHAELARLVAARGGPAERYFEQAFAHFEVLQRLPSAQSKQAFTLLNMGWLWSERAAYEIDRDLDATDSIAAGAAAVDGALALRPGFELVLLNRAGLRVREARAVMTRGEDARELLEAALGQYAEIQSTSTNRYLPVELVQLHLLRAANALDHHPAEVDEALDAAQSLLEGLRKSHPSLPQAPARWAELFLLRARQALALRRDPSAHIAEGLAMLDDPRVSTGVGLTLATLRAELLHVSVQWTLRSGGSSKHEVELAEAVLDEALAREPQWVTLWTAKVRLYRTVAEHGDGYGVDEKDGERGHVRDDVQDRVADHERDWIAAGLEAAGRALEVRPNYPPVLAERGMLRVLAARTGATTAADARRDLEHAAELRPALRDEVLPWLARLERMAE